MAYEDVRDRHLKQWSKNVGFGAKFPPILEPRSVQVRSKIDSKTDTNFACILTSIFNRFGSILGPKMGGLGGPKFCVFRSKIGPDTPRPPQDAPRPPKTAPRSILDRFWTDFGPIWNRFWTDFGPIWIDFGRFWTDLGSKMELTLDRTRRDNPT